MIKAFLKNLKRLVKYNYGGLNYISNFKMNNKSKNNLKFF